MRISATVLGLLVVALALALALTSSTSCAAEPRPFDREMSLGEACAKEKKWHEAILHYKRGVRMEYWGRSDLQLIEADLEGAMHERPLDPDGHIALGIYYMNFLLSKYRPSDQAFLFDQGQPEIEFNVALSLSKDHNNPEATELLQELTSRQGTASDHNKVLRCGNETRRDLLVELLTSRWTPPAQKGYLVVRIYVSTDDDARHREPTVRVASASSQFDAVAVKVVSEAIADFPLLPWSWQELVFASDDGRASVFSIEPGQVMRIGCREVVTQETRDEAEKYVTNRWTDERVKDFCRPENSKPRCMRPWGFDLPGRGLIMGESSITNWVSGVSFGVPVSYLVYRGSHHYSSMEPYWLLEYGPAASVPGRDDDFVCYRLKDTLLSCIRNYELVHLAELDRGKWKERRIEPRTDQLIRDDTGRPVVYKCDLESGSTVLARFDGSGSIKEVLVDGIPDAIWNTALTEAVANIAKLNSFLNFYGVLDGRFESDKLFREEK